MIHFMLVALLATPVQDAAVQHIALPHGGQVPDAVVATDGRIWVTYGREGDVYFQTLDAEGHWAGDEVRISSVKKAALIGGERGPHMSIGKDGVIHVIWTGKKDAGIAYTRSLDRGKTWEPQRNLLEPKIMAEGPTVSADADGNVIAAWLDGRLGETKEAPVSFALVVRRSSDNGKSFSPPAAVSEAAEDRACMCCELSSMVSSDGAFRIAHRKAFKNIRDMTMWQWQPGGDWQRQDVSDDGWKFAGCPMTGAALSDLSNNSGVAIAWMSEGIVYSSTQDAAGKFSARKRISPKDRKARYVGLASTGDGRQLVTWYTDKTVYWDLLGGDGISINHGHFPHKGIWKAQPIAINGRFFVIF